MGGARQAMSSLEPWSIAFRIWFACVVLGSSLRSSATNSSRLALMPRTSSNEAKYASAPAANNLNAFGSSVSTKETIHWMQSSRAMMVRWSRSLASQSSAGGVLCTWGDGDKQVRPGAPGRTATKLADCSRLIDKPEV